MLQDSPLSDFEAKIWKLLKLGNDVRDYEWCQNILLLKKDILVIIVRYACGRNRKIKFMSSLLILVGSAISQAYPLHVV